MHITWLTALLVVLGERKRKVLSEDEAEHFLYVVYHRTVPQDFPDALRQVREIMEDPKTARKLTT